MRTGGSLNSTTSTSPTVQHSPWHSPVPYLFGGLAAMLGLIAFALLILACSYWKLSGHLDGGEGGERDVESGGSGGGSGSKVATPPVFEEKIVVIMAGDDKPTFLATPVCSRAASFEDSNGKSEEREKQKAEKGEKKKQEMNHQHDQTMTEENVETQQHTQDQNQ